MEFRQLAQFLAVVEHGGLVRAAAALHISQPSLSQTIRGLERELKTPLFHRVGRGVVLTAAGEALVDPARQLIRDVATARASVAEVAGIRTGRLDIAAMGSPLQFILPVVGEFRHRHPDVFIGIETPAMESDILRQVREGRSELGFLPFQDEANIRIEAARGRLELVRLGVERMKLVMPPGFGTTLPDPLPIERLPDLPTTAAPLGAHGRDAVEKVLRRAGLQTRLGVVTAHRSTQCSLVLRGIGMTFSPEGQVDQAVRAGAVVRDLDPPILLPYGLVRRSGHLSPSAAAFLDLAVERVRERGGD
ncbi:LysR family transcriptional regulator [Prescottella equi]|uniref:LysR family transcriptional regulator n=1 Tax=Rhodococcus hoagii TaxID=43767 RepID=UPI00384C79C7